MSKISLIAITMLLGLFSLAGAAAQSFQSHQDDVANMYHLFKDWVGQVHRQYGIEELAVRFFNWKENFDFVQEHNKQGFSYELELNKFGDLTGEEFSALHLGFDMGLRKLEAIANNNDGPIVGMLKSGNGLRSTPNTTDAINSTALPKSVDWRLAGAVTPVKNQKKCGSCWAFSAAGALEGLYAIKNNKIVTLSEQQMVDCSTEYGNMGCNGGVMELAYNYTMVKGIQLESDYQYVAQNDSCKYDESKVVFKNTNYTIVPANDSLALKAAVAQQPVAVAIEASSLTLQLFKSGIYSEGCSTKIDHAVLIVGYDTSPEGKDYWIVKNSWGTKWGNKGYINIEMGDQNAGLGVCGINVYATYPTL